MWVQCTHTNERAEVIRYTPALDIRNTDDLPRGTGAKYLECVRGPDNVLIAKQWRDVKPETYAVLVQFKGK